MGQPVTDQGFMFEGHDGAPGLGGSAVQFAWFADGYGFVQEHHESARPVTIVHTVPEPWKYADSAADSEDELFAAAELEFRRNR
jgi:hypothetical protein